MNEENLINEDYFKKEYYHRNEDNLKIEHQKWMTKKERQPKKWPQKWRRPKKDDDLWNEDNPKYEDNPENEEDLLK